MTKRVSFYFDYPDPDGLNEVCEALATLDKERGADDIDIRINPKRTNKTAGLVAETPIDKAGLTIWQVNKLKGAGYYTVGSVWLASDAEISQIPGMNANATKLIREKLSPTPS